MLGITRRGLNKRWNGTSRPGIFKGIFVKKSEKREKSSRASRDFPFHLLAMFPPSRPQDSDASIRLTDTDAAAARLSAVQKGYLQDEFVKYLVPRAHLQSPRPPLINVGTFVRTTAIDDLVQQWLRLSGQAGKPCQIVSLGAGSDTRFWRISVRSYHYIARH